MKIDTLPTIKPSQLKSLLRLFWKTKECPLFIHGRSGIGKTQIIKQFGKEVNAKVINYKIMYVEPTDIKGFPFIDKETKRTYWFVPEEYPDSDSLDGFIFFYDEVSSAASHLQNAILEPLAERRVGTYNFPKNTLFVLAGNVADEGCFVNELSAALIKRCFHYHLEANIEDSLDYFSSQGVIPEIIAHLKINPRYLDGNPSDGSLGTSSENEVEPCPRNWEELSRIIKTNSLNIYDDRAVISLLAQARVGQVAGTQFVATIDEVISLFTVEELLKETQEFYDNGKSVKLEKLLKKVDTDSKAWCLLYNLEYYAKSLEKEKLSPFFILALTFFFELDKLGNLKTTGEILNMFYNQVVEKVALDKKLSFMELTNILSKSKVKDKLTQVNSEIKQYLASYK